MAQVNGVVSGLQIETIIDPEDSADDDDAIASQLLDAYRCYKRGQYKASAAHAVDAVNLIAAEFSISCGASL